MKKTTNILFKSLCVGLLFFAVSCSDKDNYIKPYEKFVAVGTTPIGQKLVNGTDLVAKVYKDTSYQLVPGLTATEFNYLATKGYVMKIFIFQVELSNTDIDIKVSTANNSATYNRQKMTEQAALVDANGHKVWAGTNGDFFDGTTGIPQGPLHKNGIVIKSTFASTVNTFFGITNDGKAIIGNEDLYSTIKSNLKETLGGRATLLKEGIIPPSNVVTDPRTAVGVSKDGKTVFMMVVDGRRYTYSNGMNYVEMGKCFKAIGAYNAINLDGGGSSTFLIRNTPSFDPNRFEMRNWPWDNGGEQRAVSNGLLVISKTH